MSRRPRTPVPALEVRLPGCPICHESVNYDGSSFWCETCGCTWGSDGYDDHGEASAETEQCPAEVMPYADGQPESTIGHYRYRCVRDVGHPAAWEDHIGARVDDPWEPSANELYEWREGEHSQAPPPIQGPSWMPPVQFVRPIPPGTPVSQYVQRKLDEQARTCA